MTKIKFNGAEYEVSILRHQFGSKPVAIALTNRKDELVASVFVEGAHVESGYTLIKNYSELEGMLDVLVEGGVVEKTSVCIRSGFVDIPKVKVLKDIIWDAEVVREEEKHILPRGAGNAQIQGTVNGARVAVLNFYDDEIYVDPKRCEGLTLDEAREYKRKLDVHYLQS